MILVTQLIYLIEDQEKVFDEFERMAIPIIATYQGKLLLRIRPGEDSYIECHMDKPYEIHPVAFPHQGDFERLLKDEERQKYLHLKEKSIKEAILIQGTRLI